MYCSCIVLCFGVTGLSIEFYCSVCCVILTEHYLSVHVLCTMCVWCVVCVVCCVCVCVVCCVCVCVCVFVCLAWPPLQYWAVVQCRDVSQRSRRKIQSRSRRQETHVRRTHTPIPRFRGGLGGWERMSCQIVSCCTLLSEVPSSCRRQEC